MNILIQIVNNGLNRLANDAYSNLIITRNIIINLNLLAFLDDILLLSIALNIISSMITTLGVFLNRLSA